MDVKSSRRKLGSLMFKFPYPIIIVTVFVVLGMTFHIWHPLWMLFLTIPIYYHYAAACMTKSKKAYYLTLPVPEIIVFVYLIAGFFLHLWGVAWWIFLLIPLYYWSAAVFVKK